MDNMEIYNRVKAVPGSAMRQINAGRLKGFTDINPMWRIKTLTECFGMAGVGWFYETTDKWTETAENGDVMCFVNINLYVKVDGEWSKPIEGTGGSKIVANETKGLYADDEGYKKATTDALGIACKNLGIGADVWWSSDRTKYTSTAEAAKTTEVYRAVQIGEQQLKILRAEMQITGVTEKQIVQRYSVSKLDELSAEQYLACMRALKATQAKKGEPNE